MNKLVEELEIKLRGNVSPYEMYDGILVVLFLKKYFENQQGVDVTKLIKSIKDENINNFISQYVKKYPCLMDIATSINNLETADIDYAVNNYPNNNDFFEYATPNCLIDLCQSLLNIDKFDDILDLCSGNGNFLSWISERCNYHSLTGVEFNESVVALSKIRAYLMNYSYNVQHCDALLYEGKQYSKIFSHYPFNMQLRFTPSAKILADELKFKSYGSLNTTDWLFNYQISKLLRDNGKAVVLMTNGSLMSNAEQNVREFFLKSSLIESVIALPDKLLKNTAIPINVVVLSKEYKDKIRFVNAKDICSKGRRINELTSDNIAKIIELTKEDSELSKSVSVDEVFKSNAILLPSRYLDSTNCTLGKGIALGDVIKSITRGAPISSEDLDEQMSREPTQYQYLMLSNVKEGLIDKELPYLKNIDMKYRKYCINDRNIVMSKNGYPFKVAIYEKNNNNMVLANGNMFIIEVDETKMNPYYLKMFLDSPIGISSLKSIMGGSSIPNINQESLLKIIVPDVPIAEQEEDVSIYKSKLEEINSIKLQLDKAMKELNQIIDIKQN